MSKEQPVLFKKGYGKDPLKPDKQSWEPHCSGGKKTAVITCPGCGNFGSLAKHNISADGTIDPSIVCPWNKECGCTFHDYGKLADWPPKQT